MSDSDGEHHDDLLTAVRKLDSQKASKKKRNIGVDLEDEGLTGKQLTAASLLEGLSSAPKLDDLKKTLKQARKKHRTLDTPLNKNVKDKLERQLAYKSVKTELDKWKDVIKSNRLAEHLEFPLNQVVTNTKAAAETVGQCQPRTPLEIETAKILANSSSNLKSGELLTSNEQELIKAMSLSEAKQKLAELRRLRLLLDSRESKFRRWKKIKSKQFHRRLKKQRHKELLKDFEELKTKNPEAALEKLELLERDRVQERASLRHRGTGKWAKGLRKQAKNNPALREQLSLHYRDGKERAEKAAADESASSDDDSSADEDELQKLIDSIEAREEAVNEHDQFLLSVKDAKSAKQNPWLKSKLAQVKGLPGPDKVNVTEKPVDPLLPLNEDWGTEDTPSTSNSLHPSTTMPPSTDKKKKRKVKRKSEKLSTSTAEEATEKLEENDVAAENSEEHDSELTPRRSKRIKRLSESEAVKTGNDSSDTEDVDNEKKNKKKTKGVKQTNVDIDDMFDGLQNRLIQATKRSLETSAKKSAKKGKKKNSYNNNDDDADLIEELDQLSDIDMSDDGDGGGDSSGEDIIHEELDRMQTLKDVEAKLAKPTKRAEKRKRRREAKAEKDRKAQSTQPTGVDVDPKQLLLHNQNSADPKQLITIAPELIESLDGPSRSKDQSALLAEAFADDDVVAEFQDAKKTQIESEKPKDVDLTLPGWGDWAGPNIDPNSAKMRRKRQRFTIKAPPAKPRQDTKLGNVIISEKAGEAIRKLQVSDLPFPYKSVADFERTVRQPIGPEWNTFSGHQMLTKPRIRTATGRIIRPMNKQVTFKEHKAVRPDSDNDD